MPSFLIGSSSFLRATRTTIQSQMSSKFGQIQAWNEELAALDQLKNIFYLKTIQNILMTCWLSGERSLPFGLLVSFCFQSAEKLKHINDSMSAFKSKNVIRTTPQSLKRLNFDRPGSSESSEEDDAQM